MSKQPITVVVTISGGIVQNIHSSNLDVVAIVYDFDNVPDEPFASAQLARYEKAVDELNEIIYDEG